MLFSFAPYDQVQEIRLEPGEVDRVLRQARESLAELWQREV